MFVLRNHTVENLFAPGTTFSGYGDISGIPPHEKHFVWFYQVEPGFDTAAQTAYVESLLPRLRLVMDSMPAGSSMTVLSLVDMFPVNAVVADTALQQAIDGFNDAARNLPGVRFVDLGDFLGQYPRQQWLNWKYYLLSRMIVSPVLAGAFREWFDRMQATVDHGRPRKCLVLDLDNTLWGGIVGEDGPGGIAIGGDYPGNAFALFQQAVKQMGRDGVILALCSKNNAADVDAVWDTNPGMILGRDDFAATAINWNDKASNIRSLATRLNIGLDSMVFVDDNPAERELVRSQLPMVAVPDFPQRPAGLPAFAAALVRDYFTAYNLTGEDRQKTGQYRANALRAQQQEHFTDLTDFIRSLDIRLTIAPADAMSLDRVAQMTQKTNQFNLTTRRYTRSDIEGFMARGAAVYTLAVADRFGDSGITGAMIVRDGHIDTLLLSCRVLGKRIENAFVATVLNVLRQKGLRRVTAQYIPTAKNGQVADFYNRMGFEHQGNGQYATPLDTPLPVEDIFTVTVKQ